MQLGLRSAVATFMELRVQQKEGKFSYLQLMKASNNTEFRNRRLKKNEETTRKKQHRES